MVAIVAGNGLGLFNASLNILGSAGVLGQSVLGQAGGRSFVNAATGNLVLQMQDEQLSGRGSDLHHLRTYNSLGLLNDGDQDGLTTSPGARAGIRPCEVATAASLRRQDDPVSEIRGCPLVQYDWFRTPRFGGCPLRTPKGRQHRTSLLLALEERERTAAPHARRRFP